MSNHEPFTTLERVQEKAICYRREASLARLTKSENLRHRLARGLRWLAYRLEPELAAATPLKPLPLKP